MTLLADDMTKFFGFNRRNHSAAAASYRKKLLSHADMRRRQINEVVLAFVICHGFPKKKPKKKTKPSMTFFPIDIYDILNLLGT